jgi:hypothetical protein
MFSIICFLISVLTMGHHENEGYLVELKKLIQERLLLIVFSGIFIAKGIATLVVLRCS